MGKPNYKECPFFISLNIYIENNIVMSKYSNVEYKNMMINNILSNYKKYPEYGDKVRPLALEVWIKSNDNFHEEIFTFYEIYDEIKKELSINEDDTFNSH